MIVAILWQHVKIKKRDEFQEIINKQLSAISFNNYQVFFNLVSYNLFIIIQLKERKNHLLLNNNSMGKGQNVEYQNVES